MLNATTCEVVNRIAFRVVYGGSIDGCSIVVYLLDDPRCALWADGLRLMLQNRTRTNDTWQGSGCLWDGIEVVAAHADLIILCNRVESERNTGTPWSHTHDIAYLSEMRGGS